MFFEIIASGGIDLWVFKIISKFMVFLDRLMKRWRIIAVVLSAFLCRTLCVASDLSWRGVADYASRDSISACPLTKLSLQVFSILSTAFLQNLG